MTARRDPEKDLDDLLGERGGEMGDLYRRLPRYEPPRRLDRAVLGEAARAALSGKPPRRQRWIVGVGSAAGLVLAAGIAWRIGHDAMSQREAAPSSAAPVSTPRVVPVEPITESARAKHTQQAAAPADTDAGAAPASKAEGVVRTRSQDEVKPVTRDKVRSLSKPAAAPAQPPAETPKPAAPPPVASPQAFPGTAQDREQAQDSAKSNEAQSAPVGGAAEADRRAGPAASRAMPATTPPTSSVELRRDMQLAPQDWLSHIRQLQRQGRRQQAAESLRMFQRVHADWQVPDDLKALLD